MDSRTAMETAMETAMDLRQQIRHHDRLYYGLDAPETSDQAYNDLMRRLREVERDYPGTRTRPPGGSAAPSRPTCPRWPTAGPC